MPNFPRDGLNFHYRDAGDGLPFVFQHGLGGDVNQPFGLFPPPAGVRLLAFDCRAHGETRPLGPAEKIGIAAFAEDLAAFLDHVRVRHAAIGGISMGAALAVHFALRFPDRVTALVLSRPAWLEGPLPTRPIYALMARLIREHGARRGLERFKQSAAYDDIRRRSPDAAQSLALQFEHPRAEETVVKFERIPADTPTSDLRDLARIAVPALVLASRLDPIHPYEFGEALARAIPGAVFREITPKSSDLVRHAVDVQTAVTEFLRRPNT